MSRPTILAITSFFKGNDFLRQCKREGCTVLLLTVDSLLNKAWARDACDDVFAIQKASLAEDREATINAVCFLMRKHNISRIAPLDDYDVEVAAMLREYLRLPGMGDTTARYFRDKLAMRSRAKDRGIAVPEFVHVLNHEKVTQFFQEVSGPWMFKPRSEASSVGIRKVTHPDEIWPHIHELGDAQHKYLIEKMIPGDVFHVDAITWNSHVVFAECHQYRRPLFDVSHGGGIFGSSTVERGSELERRLLSVHTKVLAGFRMARGVTHTEFIRSAEDGTIYFLETAARVGGVHISDLVEASTGVNLWAEWAKVEIAQDEHPYEAPERRADYGGLVVSLARQEVPDTSAYTDPEIVWRMEDNLHHVGLVVKSPTLGRVTELLHNYEARFHDDFHAVMPAAARATA